MLFDLHVHTAISPCSELSLDVILAEARSRGLDGVCLTDHDTMRVLDHVQEGPQPDGLIVIVGLEYATDQGDFLLFGPFEDLPPGLPAPEVLGLAARLGGVAVAAHPFRPGRSLDEVILTHGLCGAVEIRNGRTAEVFNQQALELAERFGLPGTGGSDAHSVAELGRVRTRFLTPVRTRADLTAALTAGLCRPSATGLPEQPMRIPNCNVDRFRVSAPVRG